MVVYTPDFLRKEKLSEEGEAWRGLERRGSYGKVDTTP
jgi:hypothetical protein